MFRWLILAALTLVSCSTGESNMREVCRDAIREVLAERDAVADQDVQAMHTLDALKQAVQAYYAKVGDYPLPDEGLRALTKTVPPIMGTLPVDPWGNAFRYERLDTPGRRFLVTSSGPDGEFGTADDIR